MSCLDEILGFSSENERRLHQTILVSSLHVVVGGCELLIFSALMFFFSG